MTDKYDRAPTAKGKITVTNAARFRVIRVSWFGRRVLIETLSPGGQSKRRWMKKNDRWSSDVTVDVV